MYISQRRETTAFSLDYDGIRALTPDQDYLVSEIDNAEPLLNPDTGESLESGTRIRLTQLHLKRALAEPQFMRSMGRRFAISVHEMRISINGNLVERFSIPVQIRFPEDGTPNDDIEIVDEGWAIETLDGGDRVRWWIGFTEHPLGEDAHLGISVLANKKMLQRPFKFERTLGTEGQLGQEYLVGEVEADWLDIGIDIEDDLIQSNRDQLQLEDVRLDEFLSWGRKRLAWALRERNRLRSEYMVSAFQTSPLIDELLDQFTQIERRSLLRVASTVSRLPEITSDQVDRLMRDVVNSRSDVAVRELMEQIESESEAVQERMWALVQEFGLIDARRTMSIIEARLETIAKLRAAVSEGAREIPDIHNIIRDDAWLLDPRWHLLDDEVDIANLGVDYDPELDPDSGRFVDFLFVLQPASPAPIDEVVVVEIKRGTNSDGSVRHASESEIHKFQSYLGAIQNFYEKSTDRPRVRGLMIAEGYTPKANQSRQMLEQIGDPKMEFKSWARVMEETERMHLGWLNVSQRRVDKSS